MTSDRHKDREAPKAFRDEDKTLPSPVIRGATGQALGPGRVLDGRYTLVERIGAGGWGEVWRSVQNSTRREVALKILRRDVAEGEGAEERFQLEAEAVSCLVHQNTVTLFDYGRSADGETYMAMELLDGESLDQILRKEGPMAPARALQVVRQIALSLDEAHGKGIVHRDVKPHNIMLLQRPGEPDFVKVLDFGVAKWVLEDHNLTTTGTTFGTPEYMSPEQVQSKPLDHRSDLYSLGVILYTLLAARPPFRGESPITVALQHINKRIPPLPRDRGIPRDVERLIQSLTQKQPTRRPFSAAEVAETCDGILRNMETGAPAAGRRPGPWIALLLGLLVGTTVFALWRPWDEEGSAPALERSSGSFGPTQGEGREWVVDAAGSDVVDVVVEGGGSKEDLPPLLGEVPGDVSPGDGGAASAADVAGDSPPSVAVGDTSPNEGGGAKEEDVHLVRAVPGDVSPEDGGAASAVDVAGDRPLSVAFSDTSPNEGGGSKEVDVTPESAIITITSRVHGAVARLPGGVRCPCPCRLEREAGARLRVTVHAPDHEDRRLSLRFREGDKVVPAKLVPVPLSDRDGLKGDEPPSSTDGLK